MDKQREEFEQWYDIESPDVIPKYYKIPVMDYSYAAWKAAQAAMQPETDRLASDKDELNDLAEKQDQQLSAANQRNKELEATLNQVRSTYNQIIAEDTATRNEYLDEIAKLEERIRVADAEEPVGESTSGGEARIYSGIPLPRLGSKLYLHAQIPAEVELKAKIAELEAIINESQPAYSNKIVPDSQCKQSKCANATTGCVGHCRLDELSKGLSVTYTCQLVKEK